MLTKKIVDDMYWIGALDPDLRVFDIVMRTEFGTTYNSYLLRGTEKTVIFEAVKERFFDEYMEKIHEIIPLEKVDYLVVNHTEPDHTGSIERMLEIYPDLKVVGTKAATGYLKEITNKEFSSIAVKPGDSLDIGGKTLEFIIAPNLHWPDTMFTYVPEIKALFSCDFFGSHYSDENVTSDAVANHADYLGAAKYYFDGIMGPFRDDVVKALVKLEGLPIDVIAPGHGPVLTETKEIIDLYSEWSKPRQRFEKKTVIIPYVSAYGYTKTLAEEIAAGIAEAGDIDVRLHDMVYADRAQIMSEIESADGFLLGTPTMVGEALPPILAIAAEINGRIHRGKFCSAFGSYGWSGEGVPHIIERLRQTRLKVCGDGLRARFKPDGNSLAEAKEFGRNFGNSIMEGRLPDGNKG